VISWWAVDQQLGRARTALAVARMRQGKASLELPIRSALECMASALWLLKDVDSDGGDEGR